MINFQAIEARLPTLAEEFFEAKPYSHVVIDDFADAQRLFGAMEVFPTPGVDHVNKSRDYIFAKNKFEKSDFKSLSHDCQELYTDFMSPRFERIVREITGQEVFIDPDFIGGGIHQGGADSFLDMHVDFNYHPSRGNWFRNLNILLYLNPEWKPEYGGELKLKDPNDENIVKVQPLFNRCVIMLSRDFTLHGYDRINFPEGTFRRSIAAYAYSLDESPHDQRMTKWVPENASLFKKAVNSALPMLIKAKHRMFGSATAKSSRS